MRHPSNYNYNKGLKGIARALRKQYTPGEKKLWHQVLSNSKMLGYSFTRQRAIDNYVADFFCKDLMLLIEVDGMNHDYQIKYDNERDRRLYELGYETVRFTHYSVITDIENVAKAIAFKVMEIEKVKGLPSKIQSPT